jgi:hypothetical protein
MYVTVRRYGAAVLGVLIALGPWSTRASAQIVGALGQAGLNAAAIQHPFAAAGGFRFGAGVGANYGALQGMNRGLGYGSLMNSGYGGMYGGMSGGGYLGGGSLAANNIAGAMIGLGYGGLGAYYSGMNTAGIYSGLSGGYQGYLSGAASVTTANAQYWQTIAQARIYNEEARRSRIQTRRAMIEQAEYERAHMPDPEKIRKDNLIRELDRARSSPPLTEIWSGNALNVLLRNLIAQQGQGVRGPNVPLSEDTLKSINPTTGDSRANIGLLKDKGDLQWPQSLKAGPFKEARDKLARNLKDAVNTVSVGNSTPASETLNDLAADLKKLQDTLDAGVSDLSPDQFIEAKRYLRMVGNAVTALRSPDVANWFNNSRKLNSKNVAELIKFMTDKGLWFAPAAPGEESAYLALYHALAAYDAATARMSGSGGNGGGDNK